MIKNQKGFSAPEVLLLVLIVAIVVAVGGYIFSQQNKKTNNSASSATSNSTPKTSTPTNLTLQDAVKQSQAVYDALSQYNSTAHPSSPSTAGKPWDINFINDNKAWFSSSFTNKANSSGEPSNKYLLMCFGGSAYVTGFVVTGDSSTNGIAKVTVQEEQHNQLVDIKLPIYLSIFKNAWVVDSVDSSSCT